MQKSLRQVVDDVTRSLAELASFGVLSTAERKSSPHFCGAPGDAKDSYPVPDAAHARNALARAHFSKDPGHVRSCVARVVKEEGWDVNVSENAAENVSRETVGAVSFAWDKPAVPFAAPAPQDEWVVREGPIFRVGDYPERDFSLTPAEADAEAAAFQGVDLELEHYDTRGKPNILSGRLGRLESIWRQGEQIYARARLPSWVDRAWAESGRKASAVWDRGSKSLLRCGLVIEPAIADAAMMSAGAAFAGAAISRDNMARIQTMHDQAVALGANCDPANMIEERDEAPNPPQGGYPANLRDNPRPYQTSASTYSGENKSMSENANKAAAADTAQGAGSAEFAAENKKLRERLEILEAERRLERAGVVVRGLIETEHRLLPAAFDDAVASLARAYEDDDREPVLFAATAGGTKRNRADTLVALWRGLPAHNLNAEGIPVNVLAFAQERKAEDNPMTPQGADAAARSWAKRMNGRSE